MLPSANKNPTLPESGEIPPEIMRIVVSANVLKG